MSTVAKRFALRAHEHGSSVAVEAEPGTMLEADGVRIEQALGNLVENALMHGAGAVVLAARVEGDGVELSVSDEGAGFPLDFAEQAFDRFSRADEARSHGGSGLGLAIVDLITRAHGGRAEVRNRRAAEPSSPSGYRPWRPSRRRSSRGQARRNLSALAPLHRDFISLCSSFRVDSSDRQAARRRAVEVRARASDRGRRLILVAIGLSAALAGAFGALAAGSTHTKKAARVEPALARRRSACPRRTRRRLRRHRRVASKRLRSRRGTSRGGDSTAGRDLGRLVTALRASAFEAIGTTARVVVTDPVALPADARSSSGARRARPSREPLPPHSELVLLNQARGQARRVSPLLLEALSVAVRAAELTDGIVSPMVGRTLRLAGYDRTFALVAGRDGAGSRRSSQPSSTGACSSSTRSGRPRGSRRAWSSTSAQRPRRWRLIQPPPRLPAPPAAAPSSASAATFRWQEPSRPAAGQSASPIITPRPPTGPALRSRSRAVALPPPVPPPDAGARRAANCTTSSTPAPAGRLARPGGQSLLRQRRASTRIPRARRRSCSGRRRRVVGSARTTCAHRRHGRRDRRTGGWSP